MACCTMNQVCDPEKAPLLNNSHRSRTACDLRNSRGNEQPQADRNSHSVHGDSGARKFQKACENCGSSPGDSNLKRKKQRRCGAGNLQSKASHSGDQQDEPVPKKSFVREPQRFKGVRQRATGKYVAEIKGNSHGRLWLGTFNTAEEAAIAYDEACREIRGRFAVTNFSAEYPAPEWALELAAKKAEKSMEGNSSKATERMSQQVTPLPECFDSQKCISMDFIQELETLSALGNNNPLQDPMNFSSYNEPEGPALNPSNDCFVPGETPNLVVGDIGIETPLFSEETKSSENEEGNWIGSKDCTFEPLMMPSYDNDFGNIGSAANAFSEAMNSQGGASTGGNEGFCFGAENFPEDDSFSNLGEFLETQPRISVPGRRGLRGPNPARRSGLSPATKAALSALAKHFPAASEFMPCGSHKNGGVVWRDSSGFGLLDGDDDGYVVFPRKLLFGSREVRQCHGEKVSPTGSMKKPAGSHSFDSSAETISSTNQKVHSCLQPGSTDCNDGDTSWENNGFEWREDCNGAAFEGAVSAEDGLFTSADFAELTDFDSAESEPVWKDLQLSDEELFADKTSPTSMTSKCGGEGELERKEWEGVFFDDS